MTPPAMTHSSPPPASPIKRLAVLGAGTMGAGIAQLGIQAGCATILFDPDPNALESGARRLETGLHRWVAKRILTDAQARDVLAACRFEADLTSLTDAEFVIEAAPERLELKCDLFASVCQFVADDCVLATNTSSFSVTEIAAACTHPGRVVGMHFFNPAPVMRLVEIVAAEQTSAATLESARQLGQAMNKRVIDAADVAGFLVNRCNRPYSLESLRMLEQRIAGVEQIDRIARLHGGFRMGPFELMDLVGIDTNHAVAESFQWRSYGESRYRPSPLAARKVAAGTLGRKTGRGWYEYSEDDTRRGREPFDAPSESPPAERGLLVHGRSPLADAIRARAGAAGWELLTTDEGVRPWLVVDCDGAATRLKSTDTPTAVLLERGSLHHLDPAAAGFYVVPPLDAVKLLEITTSPSTQPAAVSAITLLARTLGWQVEHVADTPGLVLGRIVAQLVNEAAFLLGEGNGAPDDIDEGMRLGVHHPYGPVEWSSIIGVRQIVTLLDALHAELGEERYRVAPLLRRCVAVGAELA